MPSVKINLVQCVSSFFIVLVLYQYKMKKSLLFFALSLFTGIVSQAQLAEGPFDQLIIRGVTLINGNGAPPLGPVDVVVENDVITQVKTVGYPGVEISSKRRPALKAGGKEINAEGMYLLPGFIDMHGHIGGVAQGADWDYVFKLWLAHGVTTVREPSGRSRDWALDLKKKSAQNKIIAPRIIQYTGFGAGAENGINTPEEARAWVRANAKAGSDGIKFLGLHPKSWKPPLTKTTN